MSLDNARIEKVVSVGLDSSGEFAKDVTENSIELLPDSAHKKRVASLDDDSDLALIELINRERCESRGTEAVIVKPAEELRGAEIEEDVENHVRQIKSITNSLSQSNDGDHLFAAAIFGAWHRRDHELFERAISSDPDNGAYRFFYAAECMRGKVACDSGMAVSEFVRVDSDNSEAYLHRAMDFYSKGQLDLALLDMKQAATMPRTEDYFTDLVLILERSLDAIGMGFTERASMAFGISATNGTLYSNLSTMCKEMSAADERWHTACVDYLELAAQRTTTSLGEGIILGVLRAVHQNSADTKRAEEATQRYATYSKRQKAETRKMYLNELDNQYYLFESPRLFHDYMNHMKTHNERSAQQYLDTEAKRFRANGWLSP
ncbi:MAG: hypothetical protein AAF385_08855 [Pseudomonadota bacterium]